MSEEVITALPAIPGQPSLSPSTTLQDDDTMPRQKPPVVEKWNTRTTEFDTDIMVICAAHPEFMVTATYNLVPKAEEQLYPGQFRHGTIYVNPVSPFWQPAYPGNKPPIYAKRKLPAGILDVKFHPTDKTLLAVSLSDMTMHFFRFAKRGDILSRRVITELIPLGAIKVADRINGCQVLLTQIRWLDLWVEVGDPQQYTNNITTQIVIALSSGEIITVKAKLSGVMSTFDPRLSRLPAIIDFSRETVHKHDLEAWTVTTMPLDTTPGREKLLVLSGADDSKLMASIITLDTSSLPSEHSLSPPTPLWTDSKTHGSGVTAILPLAPTISNIPEPQPTPLLTGSYDETLRLFTLNPHTHRRQPLQPLFELPLGGGVWHIKLMDHYVVPLRRITPPHPTDPPADHRQQPAANPLPAHETHYVCIVACMHEGAAIVRVTHVPSPLKPEGTWTMCVAARLGEDAHVNLVYDVEARKEWLGLPVVPYPDLESGLIDVPGKTTMDSWSAAWLTELEELFARRKVMPLVVKKDVKWKDALLGELEEKMKDDEVEVDAEAEAEDEVDCGKKVKGRGKAKRKGKGKSKEKQVQKDEDKEIEEAMADLNVMTAWEKEQYDRHVGLYHCLSVGFYDHRLNAWAWTDPKRREGVGLREFLEQC